MQRVYAREGNRLHLDYAGHVNRFWIGEVTFTLEPYNLSILAPVLLASKSLAVYFRRIFILDRWLKYASDPHIDSHTDHKSSPLPWSTKTLMLSGHFDTYSRPTAERDTFLVSISQIIFLPTPSCLYPTAPDNVGCDQQFKCHFPAYAGDFPWASLKSPQTVTFAFPHLTLSSRVLHRYRSYSLKLGAKDMHVMRLMIPAPVELTADRWSETIERHAKKGRVGSFDVCATVRPRDTVVIGDFHWEQSWACSAD
jgi:hypothetical protein